LNLNTGNIDLPFMIGNKDISNIQMNDNCLEDINKISEIIDSQNKLIMAL